MPWLAGGVGSLDSRRPWALVGCGCRGSSEAVEAGTRGAGVPGPSRLFYFGRPCLRLPGKYTPLVGADGSEALRVKGVPLHPMAGAGMMTELFQVPARPDVPDPHRALSGGGGYSIAVGVPGHAVYRAGLPGEGHLLLGVFVRSSLEILLKGSVCVGVISLRSVLLMLPF